MGQGEACEAARDACQEGAPPGVDCNSVDTADLQDCDVTVSVVASCLDEVGEFAGGVTCDSEPPFSPPKCFTDVRANCPLFR
jgi:ubiquitin-protein ligase